MRRACFYLFLFVSICWTRCRCRWMLLFLPLGAHGGVLLGVPKWMAWPSSAAWPGGHRAVVLAAEDVGADSRKAEKWEFPWAFAWGIATPQGRDHGVHVNVDSVVSAEEKQRMHGQSSPLKSTCPVWDGGSRRADFRLTFATLTVVYTTQ